MSEPEKKYEKHKSRTVHIITQAFAIILLIAGVIMLVIPGPGLLTIVIALIILGEESRLGRWIISKLPQKIREEIHKKQRKK